MNTSFISFETIKIIFDSLEDNEIEKTLDLLIKNSLIERKRINGVPGYKVHDVIVETIKQRFLNEENRTFK
jgi:hypothetical protein